MKNFLIALLLLIPVSGLASAETYKVDPDHSIVSFKIGHLIGKVRGSFSDFTGEIQYDQKNLKKFKATGKIDIASIDTNNTKRDNHLKNPDFFDIENPKKPEFKHITFKAKNFTAETSKAGIHRGKLSGYISIHGVEKYITLDATINGDPVMDPFGNARISISAMGTLNRQDFELRWQHPAGELVVGDIIELELEIQGVRKIKTPKKKVS